MVSFCKRLQPNCHVYALLHPAQRKFSMYDYNQSVRVSVRVSEYASVYFCVSNFSYSFAAIVLKVCWYIDHILKTEVSTPYGLRVVSPGT